MSASEAIKIGAYRAFAQRMEAIMAERGWSHLDVARAAHGNMPGTAHPRSSSNMRDILHGRQRATRQSLEKLAPVMGLSVAEMVALYEQGRADTTATANEQARADVNRARAREWYHKRRQRKQLPELTEAEAELAVAPFTPPPPPLTLVVHEDMTASLHFNLRHAPVETVMEIMQFLRGSRLFTKPERTEVASSFNDLNK